MNFDTIEGLNEKDIINIYDNSIIEGLDYNEYLTRCDCWNVYLDEEIPSQYIQNVYVIPMNYYCKDVHDNTPTVTACKNLCNSQNRPWQWYDEGCGCRNKSMNWNLGYRNCPEDWN